MAGAIAGLGVRVSEANDTREPPAAEASLPVEAPPALIGIQSTDASPNLLQVQRTYAQPPRNNGFCMRHLSTNYL